MSVVADFTISSESFSLHRALTAEPAMTVEAERLATHSSEWVLPFLWASGGDFETFNEALLEDPTVSTTTVIQESDGSVLYQIRWSDGVIDLVDEIINQHANILQARANNETWRLQLRFVDDSQVSAFQNYFAEKGHSFEVNKLYHPSVPRQRTYDLTAVQHETLVTAVRVGYFNVPRAVSMEELAEILGISSNAVSQRLRRACAALIQDTLIINTADRSDQP